tara:strand:- start:3170 stop:3844 length:675 start_codon:yes stop_codon:yes gene_type:complete
MLLYSGCSVTYGDELQGPEETEEGHKNRLAKRYSALVGLPHVNIARCGISNDIMVMETIDLLEKNSSFDFVIAQFITPERISYWDGFMWNHIMPHNSDKVIPAKMWYKWLDCDEQRMMNLWKNVYLLEQYLEKRDIPHYFWRVSYTDPAKNKVIENTYWKASKWKNMTIHTDLIGRRRDNPENYAPDLRNINHRFGGGHPGEAGHRVFADHIQGILPKHLYQSS